MQVSFVLDNTVLTLDYFSIYPIPINGEKEDERLFISHNFCRVT